MKYVMLLSNDEGHQVTQPIEADLSVDELNAALKAKVEAFVAKREEIKAKMEPARLAYTNAIRAGKMTKEIEAAWATAAEGAFDYTFEMFGRTLSVDCFYERGMGYVSPTIYTLEDWFNQ